MPEYLRRLLHEPRFQQAGEIPRGGTMLTVCRVRVGWMLCMAMLCSLQLACDDSETSHENLMAGTTMGGSTPSNVDEIDQTIQAMAQLDATVSIRDGDNDAGDSRTSSPDMMQPDVFVQDEGLQRVPDSGIDDRDQFRDAIAPTDASSTTDGAVAIQEPPEVCDGPDETNHVDGFRDRTYLGLDVEGWHTIFVDATAEPNGDGQQDTPFNTLAELPRQTMIERH